MELKEIIMSFENWQDKYKPILNPLNETKEIIDEEDYQIHWNTIEENDLIKDHIGSGQVWTVVEGDRDSLWLKSGFHRVNRMYHYITQIPVERGEEIQIELWEGYPEITQEDLNKLKEIRNEIELGFDTSIYNETLDKIIKYVERISLN